MNEEKIRKEINNLADTKYKEFHEKLCPGTNNIIGIRVPILRNYAKNLAKQYSTNELLENIGDKYYEEIMLQGMIIGLNKDLEIQEILMQIEKFIPKIDNWAICDTFCAGLKITNKNKELMWDFIQKYLNSNKEFEVRFGIVMILDYFVEEKYLKEIFNIFEKIKIKKYYVQMAIAWAISICFIKYYDKTIKYIKTSKLDNFTYNKSLQKAIESYRITKQQKEELKKLRKN